MTKIGICNFCGQQRYVELPEDTKEERIVEEAHYRASLECNCKEGSDWRADLLIIEKCSDHIEMMFRDSYPEIADIFQDAKSVVYSGTVKRITCTTPEGGVAAMYKKGAGIELKFTEKHETKMSADW